MKSLGRSRAFTLTETIVSSSVLALILGIFLTMTDQTQRLMSGTANKVEQFQDARVAFETMSRRISQATLNTHLEYEFQTVSQNLGSRRVQTRYPTRFERTSDLRFRSGPMSELTDGKAGPLRPTHGVFFQAPNGPVDDPAQAAVLDDLLNTWGYFIELSSDEDFLPPALRGRVVAKKRFRLMEVAEPANRLRVFQFQQPKGSGWFRPLVQEPARPARAIADNVVALILLPRLAERDEAAQARDGRSKLLAPNYQYDSTQSRADPVLNSKHQLPPLMQIVMIAIDDRSGNQLDRDFRNQAAMGLDYGKLFQKPEFLEDDPQTPKSGDGDTEKFTQMLTERLGVSWRVFSTTVSLSGAKWSRSQEH